MLPKIETDAHADADVDVDVDAGVLNLIQELFVVGEADLVDKDCNVDETLLSKNSL